jgi:hypothetical protein
MDEKSIPDLLSNLLPGSAKEQPEASDQAGKRDRVLVEGLKAMVGQVGGPLQDAVNDFLDGKGALLQTTRTALRGGKKTAEKEAVTMLTKQFKLSPAIAKLISPLLVKLLPSIGGEETEIPAEIELDQEKPRKVKSKAKGKSRPKMETTSSTKKAGKKTTSKPKASTSKKPAKKKTAAKSGKKETKSASKTKKTK